MASKRRRRQLLILCVRCDEFFGFGRFAALSVTAFRLTA
jgi:hypothetical protein